MRAIRINMRAIVILITTLILIASPAFAGTGVGIKYGFEEAEVIQNDITCLNYKVYNPFSNDITATIITEGDFADYQFRPKEVDLPANTRSSDSKEIDVCFKIPKIVENCDEPTLLTGNVVATTADEGILSGSGARAKVAVAAPLDLKVICGTPIGMTIMNSIEPNVFLGIGIGGLITLIIFIVWFLIKRKKKKPVAETSSKDKYMSKYSDMMVLHKKVAANIASPEELEKYKALRSELEDLRAKL